MDRTLMSLARFSPHHAGISTLLVLLLAAPALADTKTFTTPQIIGPNDLTWEGWDIVVSGTTLTVNGAHSFASLTLQPAGANVATVTHAPGFASGGVAGMALTVTGNVTVQAGCKISADGKGMSSGLGDGHGASNSTASGGAYGGAGANSSTVGGGGTYGDFMHPAEFGSGGGADSDNGQTPGGSGGGVLSLVVGGVLKVDGEVTCDGTNGVDYSAGGGSGGSILIDAGQITGSGLITADGGAGISWGGGGGGGRIAVTTDSLVLPNSNIRTYGGAGYNRGGAGTVWIDAPSFARPTLIVDNGGVAGESTEMTGPSLIPGDVLIRKWGRLGPEHGDATLDLSVTGDLVIEPTGAVYADGRGHPSGVGDGHGASNSTASGGAYGGAGANSSTVGGGGTYGDFMHPDEFGSGGGADSDNGQTPGGSGGGVLSLVVGGVLKVDGEVTCDGTNGVDYSAGGGSGGSILIDAGQIAGSGLITADGGAGISWGGGGGGGRIAVTTDSLVLPNSNIRTYGGAGYNRGGAGTVWIDAPSFARPTLIVDNGGVAGESTEMTGPSLIPGDVLIRKWGRLGPEHGDATLELTVTGDLVIESTGAVYADGRGYVASDGPGAGADATTAGGGGHGGNGGKGTIGLGGLKYGSIPNPTTLGSGGGNDSDNGPTPGGAGGGVLRLIVDGTIALQGEISADGGAGVDYSAGGGAGGSVLVRASQLQGTGAITADGGAGISWGGGGGGGRVAVYSCNSSLPLSKIHANGGTGYQPGQPGPAAIYSASVNITHQPDDTTAIGGVFANLTVNATGSGLLSYRWRFNGVPLVDDPNGVSGAFTNNLTVFNLNCAQDTGLYDVVITDSCGQAISEAAFLTIAPPGDLNGDCIVGPADLGILLGQWGGCGSECPADLSGNGVVGPEDLAILLGGWN